MRRKRRHGDGFGIFAGVERLDADAGAPASLCVARRRLDSRASRAAASASAAGDSKQKEVCCLDIHEDDQLDEAQMPTWVKQTAALPGWDP